MSGLTLLAAYSGLARLDISKIYKLFTSIFFNFGTPIHIYLFKVNSGSNSFEICSKLTKKPSKGCQWHRSDIFIIFCLKRNIFSKRKQSQRNIKQLFQTKTPYPVFSGNCFNRTTIAAAAPT